MIALASAALLHAAGLGGLILLGQPIVEPAAPPDVLFDVVIPPEPAEVPPPPSPPADMAADETAEHSVPEELPPVEPSLPMAEAAPPRTDAPEPPAIVQPPPPVDTPIPPPTPAAPAQALVAHAVPTSPRRVAPLRAKLERHETPAPAVTASVIASTPASRPVPADHEAALEVRIRDAVQAAVHYPAAARMMGLTGRARVELDYRAGIVSNPLLAQSAGAPMLDEAALAAARTARYPAAPPDVGERLLRLLVWVEFRPG